jgi:histidinol phosphatase-like enzyme
MIKNIKVIILDVDGTVAEKWSEEILPWRQQKLAQMREQGKRIFLATNQGGPAYRIVYGRENNALATMYPTLIEVLNRLYMVTTATGAEKCMVALHPGKDEIAKKLFANLQMDQVAVNVFYKGKIETCWRKEWRKPGRGIIWEIMNQTSSRQSETMYVGNEMTDFDAARAAGIIYSDTDEFFFGGPQ